MKKSFVVFLIVIIFLLGQGVVSSEKNALVFKEEDINMKGIYITYLEYLSYFQGNSLKINQVSINKMLDNIKELGFNTIFLHVSPFSDSIYKSNIFPYSYTLSGVEGKNPGMDYLEYFIKESHKRNISVHAWINPYRILSTSDLSKISFNNPAYSLLNTNDIQISDNGIYYNPASSKTLDLLLKQIYEIISNYQVDGIHLDDYFYPNDTIDLENYQEYIKENNISISEYRLNIINKTIKSIYKLIKDYDNNLIFSISLDGNIENNYELHFADVKTWLTDNNFIDIIMPEVYYGFENELKPFQETILEWNNLIKNDVKLVPVLAFYKVGNEDTLAGNGRFEWINNKNIIEREINYSKTLSNYNGFTVFRYEYLFNKNLFNLNTNEELIGLKKCLLE